MIHSLYSHPEIFLRELISNASDAADKLRFEALAHPDYYESDPDLRIVVGYDKDARTITVRDNGIGMSLDEVIDAHRHHRQVRARASSSRRCRATRRRTRGSSASSASASIRRSSSPTA